MRLAQDKQWIKTLDEAEAEQQRKHREALDRAHAEHEAVRQSAERARERVELEILRERKRREDEERRVVDKARRDLLEQEAAEQRRQLEEAKKREKAEREKALSEREKEETERRTVARKQQEEGEKVRRKAAQDQEEADREAREAAAEKQRQQQTQKTQVATQQPNGVSTAIPQQPPAGGTPQPTPPQRSATSGLTSNPEEREKVHVRYLDLHKRLKDFRRSYLKECEAKGAKQQVGDWRREINVKVGQLNKVDKAANRSTVSLSSEPSRPFGALTGV